MKSKIKPYSIEVVKRDNSVTINDAVGYFPKGWLFVVEKANGGRYMANRDHIIEINIYEGEDEV